MKLNRDAYLEDIVGLPISEGDTYDGVLSQADKVYMIEQLCKFLKKYRHKGSIEIADKLRGIRRNAAAVELAKCYVHFLNHLSKVEIADKTIRDLSYSKLVHKVIYDTYSIMTHQFYNHMDTCYYYEAMAECSDYPMTGIRREDLPQYEMFKGKENQERFNKFKSDFATAFLEAAGIAEGT